MGEVDPSGGVASSANLLALAARVESEGRYNVAKLLRAAVIARAQREADEALAAAPRNEELLEALREVAADFAADPLLAPLSEPAAGGHAGLRRRRRPADRRGARPRRLPALRPRGDGRGA
jgi:hypothetical protein